jgi:hypothetical protein
MLILKTEKISEIFFDFNDKMKGVFKKVSPKFLAF